MCRVWEHCGGRGVKPTLLVALIPLSAGSSFELSGMTYKAKKKYPFFPLIGKAVPRSCICLHQSRTLGEMKSNELLWASDRCERH